MISAPRIPEGSVAPASRPVASAGVLRVFVVTPSFNQAAYLRATIDSVLAQEYAHLDYFVADGGSTDGSVEILRSYGDRLRWVSRPDGGQAAAVADAWAASDADVLGWLNSDDVYLPGAVERAVAGLAANPAAGMVYGDAWFVDALGERLRAYPTRRFDAELLRHECFVCQPAAFVRRAALDRVGMPDRALRYCMDYDLWIRLGLACEVVHLPQFLACSRVHPETKSQRELTAVFAEIAGMMSRHYGVAPRNWAVAEMIHRSKLSATGLRRLLPQAWRHRLQGREVQRMEAHYRGPLFSDLWAGTVTLVDVRPDAAGRVSLRAESPYWPYAEPLAVAVELDGREIARRVVAERGVFHLDFTLPAPPAPGAAVQVALRANRTFVPRLHGFAPWDERPLSFMVR